MSASKLRNGANVTPASTPPVQLSDDVLALRNVIAKRSARIDELEIENATLQAQLDNVSSSREHDGQVQDTSNNATESHAELAALKQQYQDLETRYAKLQEDFDKHKKYVDQATKKYQAARDNAKLWQAYVKKHDVSRGSEAQVVTPQNGSTPMLRPPPSGPPPMPREISDIDITPKPARTESPKKPENLNPSLGADVPTATPQHQTATSSNANQTRKSPGPGTHSDRITSSQTTVDDQPQTEPTQFKHETESDEEPVVVQEKNLRRSRGGSEFVKPTRIKQEPKSPQRPGSAEEPIELRSEDWSSPTTRARPLLRMETSDLDAMRGTFQTPRKRRMRQESRARSEERSGAILHPPTLDRNTSSLSDTDIPELPIAFERAGSPSGSKQAGPSVDNITPQAKSHGRQRAALKNLSPNVPTAQQTGNKRRRISKEAAGKVGMLAEDGDEDSSQVTPKVETVSKKPDLSHRLADMLENPTPGRQPLKAHRPTPNTARRTRPERNEPQPQPEPPSHAKPPPPVSKYRRPIGIEKSPPPVDPAHEHLRLIPLKFQKPNNFKINPAYADSTHAFVDPMNRKTKAARRCLPGCINPACCGEFLDAARHGLLPPSDKSDSQVLEDMFGEAVEEIMASYPKNQHKEILIQARAQEFANKHGKHRKTFERAATPPGFWRTEMPSTQEELEDRKKAEEIERMKVEGMWREAMKGGGRWMFRDE